MQQFYTKIQNVSAMFQLDKRKYLTNNKLERYLVTPTGVKHLPFATLDSIRMCLVGALNVVSF